MASSFLLEILTPERSFFCGDVESVIVPAEDGFMSIHKNHEPVVVALAPGLAKLLINGNWKECFISAGFLEVCPDNAILFATTAEWPEEIDVEAAEKEVEEAKEELLRKQSDMEYKQSKITLARAMARLKVGRERLNM